MVDITSKTETERVAVAQSQIQFPPEMKGHIRDGEIYLKKGPVFQTAIVAGTMAVKRTSEVIPFCHQVAVEDCKFTFELDATLCCTVTCKVKTTSKTGVEMEALHGAMIASLTVYDMCKALSHEILISNTKLISKVGGKRTILRRPLLGLVLTGGKSTRMKKDKALINYKGKPHAQYIYDILKGFCEEVYLSAQKDQWKNSALANLPTIEDVAEGRSKGPISGILAAFGKRPDANWLVVACDLVHFNVETVSKLLSQFDEDAVATCYKNKEEDFPEPLCTLYTPRAREIFLNAVVQDIWCPVKVLSKSDCRLVSQGENVSLENINSPEDREKLTETSL